MTAEESIKRIKQYFEIHNEGRSAPLLDDAVQSAIAALELRVPARPNLISDGDWDGEPVYDTWECPNCGTQFEVEYEQHSCCPECGQKIEWDGVFQGMTDRETIKPTGEVGVYVMDKPSPDERLKNVLAKHQDILGVFYKANIFSLFIYDGKIHIEEACDYYYAHTLTKDECNRLSEMFRDIAYCIQE